MNSVASVIAVPVIPESFLIHLEDVLQRCGGEGLSFLFDRHAFFGLDRLVQAVAPLTAFHQTAGELVDDDDLAILDDVVDVFLVQERAP